MPRRPTAEGSRVPGGASGPGRTDRVAPCPLRLGRGTRIAVGLLLAASIALATGRAMLAIGRDPVRPDIVDFHPFYLAGRMALEGHFTDSYRVPVMRGLERAFGGGRDVWMPFVYPPLFGLVLAPFAALPLGPAFLLFTASTTGFYLAVLRRLGRLAWENPRDPASPSLRDGEDGWFWPVVLTMSPVLLIDIEAGQNGLLTGGLAGLSAALALGRRSGPAGAAAGALAFKPQMATMLPVLFVLRGDRRALAVAAASALALTGIAIAALGTGTVAGFLSSTAVVADFMAAGAFPLHRMVSFYACALSLGASPRLALALHGGVALAVTGMTMATGWRLSGGRSGRPVDPGCTAGLALMATAFVSPYFFDYDLTVFGAGLALLLPEVSRRMTGRALATLLAAVGLVGASGLVGEATSGLWGGSVSLGAPVLLACFLVILAAVRPRAAGCEVRPDPSSTPANAPAAP